MSIVNVSRFSAMVKVDDSWYVPCYFLATTWNLHLAVFMRCIKWCTCSAEEICTIFSYLVYRYGYHDIVLNFLVVFMSRATLKLLNLCVLFILNVNLA